MRESSGMIGATRPPTVAMPTGRIRINFGHDGSSSSFFVLRRGPRDSRLSKGTELISRRRSDLEFAGGFEGSRFSFVLPPSSHPPPGRFPSTVGPRVVCAKRDAGRKQTRRRKNGRRRRLRDFFFSTIQSTRFCARSREKKSPSRTSRRSSRVSGSRRFSAFGHPHDGTFLFVRLESEKFVSDFERSRAKRSQNGRLLVRFRSTRSRPPVF